MTKDITTVLGITVTEEAVNEAAVKAFLTLMKEKVEAAHREGKGGWYLPEVCSQGFLSRGARKNLDDQDYLDAAIYAMFCYFRKEMGQ